MKIFELLPSGKAVLVEEFDNLIVNSGKTGLVSALAGGDIRTRYFAWGSNATAPAVTQTTLSTEVGRKAISNQTAGTTGVYYTRCYLGPNDANTTIREFGWFAGPSATTTSGSGTMIARTTPTEFTKTSANSFIIERTDTIS